MPVDPCDIIGEILGEPARLMRNPVNADYLCPFMNSICNKRSQRISGPFPICSIYKTPAKAPRQLPEHLVTVCPRRFMEVDLLGDIRKHCWPGSKAAPLTIVHEVKMASIGMVDFVVAEFDSTRTQVREFVSVELQAIDITGSYEPAYSALLNNQQIDRRPIFGLNWANVRKRYVSQLISKGFFHHHWGTKIISVLQDHVFHNLQENLGFGSTPVEDANIVFMVYRYQRTETEDGYVNRLVFDQVVGTSHSDLMMQPLYKKRPSRDDFCKKILERSPSFRETKRLP